MDIQRGNIIVMDRRTGKLRAGQGLLQGLKVVWDHWAASFRKNENFTQIRGNFTVEYPDERLQLPQAYRNMPVLLYDDESGHELCTGCYQCQRICPPQVIHITQAKDPVTGKMVPAATEFIIEYDACMSCGFCAEVCPFDSIKMDHVFELSTADHDSLTMRKAQLNRPISYYTSIAPDLWEGVKAGAMKKLQGNIKRRPGVIGMAPSLTEKIKARRQELAEAAAAAPPAAAPAAPAAPAGKLTPEEKAAKLAAMKAANAAKKAGGEAAPAEAPAAELSPADAKAAKLAAIKAANAAKKAGGEAAPAEAPAAELSPADAKAAKLAAIKAANAAKKAAEAAPAVAAPTTGNGTAAPTDEKAARLAAIKAANAAKKAAEQGNNE
ncbi:4Fe-4S binding protein [Chloroflexales bacterium ZM16-3]|nr:4Fe-4S binding protein [Chloroflexales bacterium ZM16-3]